jgi:sugar/nucleoside kinase (ribokinase family)
MIVVGGTYIEECDWPEWKRIMGSGVRAALAVSDVSPGTELYTYVDTDADSDLMMTMSERGIKAHTRKRSEAIVFYYKHALTSPPEQRPEEWRPIKDKRWTVSGDTVLAFRLLESKVLVNAERAVFEISPRDEEIARGKVKSLALIAAEDELPVPEPGKDLDFRDAAGKLITAHNADLMIVRRHAGGGILFVGEAEHKIPAYAARQWFKIGAGNVFCAMFAHYWGEKKMNPVQAADLASRSSAYYASERALPIVAEGSLPSMEPFDPSAPCKIFVASPCASMAQQWLLNEAIDSLEHLGVTPVSAYDLGLDGVAPQGGDIGAVLDDCDAVLVLAEGVDIASVLAVGLARVRHLPIVVLAENAKEGRLDLWQGTKCEIARDFASAVYRAMVAGRKRAKA